MFLCKFPFHHRLLPVRCQIYPMISKRQCSDGVVKFRLPHLWMNYTTSKLVSQSCSYLLYSSHNHRLKEHADACNADPQLSPRKLALDLA